MIALDAPIPDFQAQATSGLLVQNSALVGQQYLLYFYPKDSTPGCTTEAQDFRDRFAQFQLANTLIFGVSRDGLRSHENFRRKQELPFELISDAEEHLCQLFEVLKMKKLYGREYLGIERSSFLVDQHGVLRYQWRNLKVKGHADQVLEAAQSLQAQALQSQ